MSNVLLIEMEFNNKTWYMSTEAYNGKAYYAPFITKNPSLEFGQVKGGYIGTRFGNLTIANQPDNRFSPFSVFSGGYAKLLSDPTQKIEVQIYWEQNDVSDALFEGTMYLKSYNTDTLSFLLEDSFKDQDLLEQAVEVDADLTTLAAISITSAGTTATVNSPDHGLNTGDLVTVTDSSTSAFNVSESSITKVDDNSFTYSISSTTATEVSGFTVKHFQKKNAPFSFGRVTREKGLIKTAKVNGFEFDNPQMKFNDNSNPLQIFDDGVLVGSSLSSDTGTTLTISSVSKLGDEVTINASGAHGCVIGTQVSIKGLTHADYNGIFTVIEVIDSDSFKVFNNSPETLSGTSGSNNLGVFGNFFGTVRAPTANTIKSRQIDITETNSSNTGAGGTVFVGTALVSGLSSNGQTVSEFFQYIAGKLFPDNDFTMDFTRAPNASSKNLELWVTSQTKLIDFAGKIAEGSNHLFRIKNKEITVIDRAEIPEDFTNIQNKDIISAGYKIPYPIKAFRSKWTTNITNTTVSPARLDQKDQSVLISNTDSGKVQDVVTVTKNLDDARTYLEAQKSLLNKTIIDLEVGDIRTDLDIGDRIKFTREEDSISVDMIIRTVRFNIDGLSTKFSGDGTITVIENSDVY